MPARKHGHLSPVASSSHNRLPSAEGPSLFKGAIGPKIGLDMDLYMT
jgi:hypothetical protein